MLPFLDILAVLSNKFHDKLCVGGGIISELLFHFWSTAIQFYHDNFAQAKWEKETPLAKYLLYGAPFPYESETMKLQICLLLKDLISVLICNKSLGAETIFLSLQIYLECLNSLELSACLKYILLSPFFPLTCSTRLWLSHLLTKMSHGDQSVKYESVYLALENESALGFFKDILKKLFGKNAEWKYFRKVFQLLRKDGFLFLCRNYSKCEKQ